jgi:hypothetical protein
MAGCWGPKCQRRTRAGVLGPRWAPHAENSLGIEIVRFPGSSFPLHTQRTKARPEGLPGLSLRNRKLLALANRVTQRTFALATLAESCDVVCTIENPRNSVMWHTKACKTYSKKCEPTRWLLDQCMFGELYQKPTVLLATSTVDWSRLARRCTRDHQHHKLSNWKSFEGQICVQTPSAAAYGEQLCACWAGCVAEHFGIT